MAWLKDTWSTLANTGRGQHTQGSYQHTSLITQDITKNITSYHGIELFWPANELHGGIIDIHVRKLDIRELLGDGFSNDITPELGDVKNIGLVDTAELSSSLAGNITYFLYVQVAGFKG